MKGKHKHVIGAVDHRVIECTLCDLRRELAPGERWRGFDCDGEPMIDNVKPTEYFCYKCGAKGLVVESDTGDYYVGPCYYCDACNSTFTMG